jgi:Domain of unknown function (DUF2019)
MTSSIPDALAEYRELVDEWAKELSRGNPRRANRLFDRFKRTSRDLIRSTGGREGIMALMADPNQFVRLVAATESLRWVPERARRVLEAIRDSNGYASFDAEMTLTEYEEGRLKLD